MPVQSTTSASTTCDEYQRDEHHTAPTRRTPRLHDERHTRTMNASTTHDERQRDEHHTSTMNTSMTNTATTNTSMTTTETFKICVPLIFSPCNPLTLVILELSDLN